MQNRGQQIVSDLGLAGHASLCSTANQAGHCTAKAATQSMQVNEQAYQENFTQIEPYGPGQMIPSTEQPPPQYHHELSRGEMHTEENSPVFLNSDLALRGILGWGWETGCPLSSPGDPQNLRAGILALCLPLLLWVQVSTPPRT